MNPASVTACAAVAAVVAVTVPVLVTRPSAAFVAPVSACAVSDTDAIVTVTTPDRASSVTRSSACCTVAAPVTVTVVSVSFASIGSARICAAVPDTSAIVVEPLFCAPRIVAACTAVATPVAAMAVAPLSTAGERPATAVAAPLML